MSGARSTIGALAALDELDPVAVRVADEAEPRAARAHGVRRALGLDALAGELLERPVEVVHGERDVPVAGAQLVGVDAEVVGELQAVVVPGQAHEDVDRLVPNRKLAALLEPERLVERDRAVWIGDSVAGVDQFHGARLTYAACSLGRWERSVRGRPPYAYADPRGKGDGMKK